MALHNHGCFDRDFDRFDPFGYRNPANDPMFDEEPEERFCECGALLATDEKVHCAECLEVSAADEAAWAAEDAAKELIH
jgi:hypothetical protein